MGGLLDTFYQYVAPANDENPANVDTGQQPVHPEQLNDPHDGVIGNDDNDRRMLDEQAAFLCLNFDMLQGVQNIVESLPQNHIDIILTAIPKSPYRKLFINEEEEEDLKERRVIGCMEEHYSTDDDGDDVVDRMYKDDALLGEMDEDKGGVLCDYCTKYVNGGIEQVCPKCLSTVYCNNTCMSNGMRLHQDKCEKKLEFKIMAHIIETQYTRIKFSHLKKMPGLEHDLLSSRVNLILRVSHRHRRSGCVLWCQDLKGEGENVKFTTADPKRMDQILESHGRLYMPIFGAYFQKFSTKRYADQEDTGIIVDGKGGPFYAFGNSRDGKLQVYTINT